ncbi:hypothetical protein [Lysobacter sp. Hz 25]|uniref:hypothetical protein n=1 Tax=Lysobacter sp. Hz 25 TaxID=3383698 RepID=UPI0038D4BC0F
MDLVFLTIAAAQRFPPGFDRGYEPLKTRLERAKAGPRRKTSVATHVPRETWSLISCAGFKNPGFATISEAWTAL